MFILFLNFKDTEEAATIEVETQNETELPQIIIDDDEPMMPLGQNDASGDISTSTTTLDMSSSTDMSEEASIHEFEDDEDSDLKIISEKLAAVEVQLQEATTSYESLKEANGAINVELTVGTLPMSSLLNVNKSAKK